MGIADAFRWLSPVSKARKYFLHEFLEIEEDSMIDDNALLKRLRDKEDNFVERKSQGIRPDDIRKTLCAFSNSLIGDAKAILFIGIHDKTGAVEGIENTDGMQKKIREACKNDCYPPITNFTCRNLSVEGKDVLAVVIGPSNEKPHFTGPAYVRLGSESVNATPAIYRDLISSRNEKAGRILEMLGATITLEGDGRKISNPKSLANFRERGEGEIVSCDAHVVRFDLTTGPLPRTELAEPLENVSIGYDTQNRRHMLIIRRAR